MSQEPASAALPLSHARLNIAEMQFTDKATPRQGKVTKLPSTQPSALTIQTTPPHAVTVGPSLKTQKMQTKPLAKQKQEK